MRYGTPAVRSPLSYESMAEVQSMVDDILGSPSSGGDASDAGDPSFPGHTHTGKTRVAPSPMTKNIVRAHGRRKSERKATTWVDVELMHEQGKATA
jgi:hypothetical protein